MMAGRDESRSRVERGLWWWRRLLQVMRLRESMPMRRDAQRREERKQLRARIPLRERVSARVGQLRPPGVKGRQLWKRRWRKQA